MKSGGGAASPRAILTFWALGTDYLEKAQRGSLQPSKTGGWPSQQWRLLMLTWHGRHPWRDGPLSVRVSLCEGDSNRFIVAPMSIDPGPLRLRLPGRHRIAQSPLRRRSIINPGPDMGV